MVSDVEFDGIALSERAAESLVLGVFRLGFLVTSAIATHPVVVIAVLAVACIRWPPLVGGSSVAAAISALAILIRATSSWLDRCVVLLASSSWHLIDRRAEGSGIARRNNARQLIQAVVDGAVGLWSRICVDEILELDSKDVLEHPIADVLYKILIQALRGICNSPVLGVFMSPFGLTVWPAARSHALGWVTLRGRWGFVARRRVGGAGDGTVVLAGQGRARGRTGTLWSLLADRHWDGMRVSTAMSRGVAISQWGRHLSQAKEVRVREGSDIRVSGVACWPHGFVVDDVEGGCPAGWRALKGVCAAGRGEASCW